MFFSVARMRHLFFASVLLSLSQTAFSREEELFTSSVSYCAPPQSLLVQQFDLSYFQANDSVSFNISAASVESQLNVSANLFLNVYGIVPVNVTIDLCGILDGALCPLPTYNFTGADSIQLPSSVDTSEVPGIAYVVPDLEAFAQLQLLDDSTGNVVACVQSTLSNGWSTRQVSVEWVTGGFALLALLSALWYSARSVDSLAAFRFLDLISLYQHIASSGLLALNFPLAYRSYTLNFSWSLGLFTSSPTSSIQGAINNMRHLTGGDLADASGSALDLVDRQLSPYNVPGSPLSKRELLVEGYQRYAKVMMKRDAQTVQVQSSNVLQAGVPVWVNALGIGTANAFMTVFLVALMLLAIVLGVMVIGWFVVLAASKSRNPKISSRAMDAKKAYPLFVRAWGLRFCIVAFCPLIIFSFYQFTLKDSWLATLLSALSFCSILTAVAYPSYRIIRIATSVPTSETLYNPSTHLTIYGPLYVMYRPARWQFFLTPIGITFIRAIFIALAQSTGVTQVIALLVLELALFVSLIALKPHSHKGANVLSVFLSFVRVLATGLMFAFIQSFGVKPIPRVVIGLVIVVVYSVGVLVMFFNIVVNMGFGRLWTERKRIGRGLKLGSREDGSQGVEGSELEKGMGVENEKQESVSTYRLDDSSSTTRPRNPTPQQHIPLDPSIIQPYPSTTPSSSSSLHPIGPLPLSQHPSSDDSVYSNDSSTATTLGNLLPRRQMYDSDSLGMGMGMGNGNESGGFDNSPRSTFLGSWTSRSGSISEGSVYYPTSQPPTPSAYDRSQPPTPSEYSHQSNSLSPPPQTQPHSRPNSHTVGMRPSSLLMTVEEARESREEERRRSGSSR